MLGVVVEQMFGIQWIDVLRNESGETREFARISPDSAMLTAN